jgi:hypothetical protein
VELQARLRRLEDESSAIQRLLTSHGPSGLKVKYPSQNLRVYSVAIESVGASACIRAATLVERES